MSPAGARETFTRFTTATADYLGKPGVFIVAVIAIVLWAAIGPVLGFSDTWQLIINTGTTLVTFLMVFIIQNTQNRDSGACQVVCVWGVIIRGRARSGPGRPQTSG